MATITKIEIDGFKAFPQNFKFNLGTGKNLLLYGENGSGKSSLYYALHVLFQSVFKEDKGAKYFKPGDINGEDFLVNDEHLINIFRFNEAKDNTYTPYIRFTFDNGKVWRLDNGGLSSENGGDESEIRMLNKNSAFINHSYVSRFHVARNSEEIDLWNVFYKDILPFHVPKDSEQFLADLYDEIVSDCKGKISMRNKRLQGKILLFNTLLGDSISRINTKVSAIYNDNFRSAEDNNLSIKLLYYSDTDPENKQKEHFYLYYGNIRNNRTTGRVDLYPPRIFIEIKENGVLIPTPQSYFNEAKLTAIALAVRFAAMTTTAIVPGSFLALDDMLISLDMSNRAKVVDFLLKISDNYKIYLFTHDRAFFNYVCRKIQQRGKTDEWIYKRMSYNINNKEPLILDEYSDYLSKAKHFYEIGDYDTSAIYLRKQLEQDVGELLPYELKTKADGGFVDLQTLWNKLVKFYSDNGKSLEPSMQTLFTDSKLLILNVAAHFQRLSNPIYRMEVDAVFKLIDYVKSLEKISNKLIVEGGKRIIFQHPTIDYKCSFELDSDLAIVQEEHIVAKIPKCKNIRWSYRGVDNWDFELNAPNDMHQLLTSTPKLTKFFLNCCEKVPLNINCEMLMKHSFIEGEVSLADYLGGVDILRISIKANL